MSVSLSYVTTEPVSPAVRKAIEADAKRLNTERSWWCENIIFYKHPKKSKHLTGDTKLFNIGLDELFEDDDEVPEEDSGDLDDDQFMGFYDARFILFTLAEWSRVHGVSWDVEMAGAAVATIHAGKIEPPSLFQADASAKQLKADDKKAQSILAKYPNR